jgi:hypothetical protein
MKSKEKIVPAEVMDQFNKMIQGDCKWNLKWSESNLSIIFFIDDHYYIILKDNFIFFQKTKIWLQ